MKSAKKILCILGLLSSAFATPTTITAPPVSDKIVVSHEKDDLKEMFGHCLHKKDVGKCLKHRVVQVIDEVTQSDDPLSVNLFHINMSLNKNPLFKDNDNVVDTSRSFEDILVQKLKNLFESRVIHVKLAEETKENSDPSLGFNEARKKKDGGKHGNMMMSGMALMAFLAQLFMSKVAFMSGAALLLAKIALLFTALSSLKKSSGSGGGEHVVYAAADSGKQGWQRSIHTMSPVVSQHQQHHMTEDMAYRGQSTLPTYDGV